MRYFILAAVILSAFGVLFAQGTTTPNLDEVIAEVNGEKITVGDFLAEFRRLSADAKNESGVYFFRFVFQNGLIITKKAVYLK